MNSKSTKNSKLTVRPVVADDLSEIEKLCLSVHFDIGIHNLKLYLETSSEKWNVAINEQNEVVALDSYNILSNGFWYGYVVLVREDYREQGTTRLLRSSQTLSMGNLMASVQGGAISKFSYNFAHWLEKRLFMFGICTKPQIDRLPTVPLPTNVSMERVDKENFHKICDYDRQIARLDRSQFVRRWSLPDDENLGFSVAAIDRITGNCLGYGTLRLFSDFRGVQPLYADSAELARAIMTSLLKRFDGDIWLSIPMVADKPEIMSLCNQLRMTCTASEIRMSGARAYRQYAVEISIDKLYSVHEYFPA